MILPGTLCWLPRRQPSTYMLWSSLPTDVVYSSHDVGGVVDAGRCGIVVAVANVKTYLESIDWALVVVGSSLGWINTALLEVAP